MSRPRSIAAGVWDFVVGDDWQTALGVVVAIALTAIVAAAGVGAWWVMPLATASLLVLSIRRAIGSRGREDP
jgi:hypothetical protein